MCGRSDGYVPGVHMPIAPPEPVRSIRTLIEKTAAAAASASRAGATAESVVHALMSVAVQLAYANGATLDNMADLLAEIDTTASMGPRPFGLHRPRD